ncbi:hypothetical protein [Aeromicrobium alkaliterrae]|uniref:Ig-like domain-containing protein n=1 Tax=Aeromicrobium alkaliterrae TaxID=302168 RepID=A0ABP4W0M7_9ACTN
MLRQSVLLVTFAVASAVTQAGCTQESDGGSATPDVVAQPDGATTTLPAVPDLPGAQGAVTDATFEDCEADAGPQSVRATLKNSTGQEVRYVVSVSWIDDTATEMARGVAEVDGVGSGRTVEVEVEADVPEGAISCTFSVLRAPDA